MRIAITGSNGLLGWHTAAHLHALNCAATFAGEQAPHILVTIDRTTFEDPIALKESLAGVDAVIHFAGVNRGSDDEVEYANPSIANLLIQGCKDANVTPAIVYANSTHASTDSPYGRSKRLAGEALEGFTNCYTNLVLPHIFGEGARPYYNNVTATLIDKIHNGETPEINPEGKVSLLHAGDAADIALGAVFDQTHGTITPPARDITVQELYKTLLGFHTLYEQNIFPDVSLPFELQLFNSYRSAGFPAKYPKALKLHKDDRGVLFESSKGGGGGQTFMSTTVPGITRGDHFHIDKVERFLVVRGKAVIRLRKVLTDELHEFIVSGDEPVAIDMIPLHTHSIENIGDEDLYTLFWTHELFDPNAPDTYADKVLAAGSK